ncbi:MAG: hypothetical protein JWN94_682 [Betaproteobacteria bacterium]|nr:hypothetical protein [Betaproteobacteria bacterium]
MIATGSTRFNYAKWCVYALVMLAPGAFVAVPALWIARAFTRWRRARYAVRPQVNAAHA